MYVGMYICMYSAITSTLRGLRGQSSTVIHRQYIYVHTYQNSLTKKRRCVRMCMCKQINHYLACSHIILPTSLSICLLACLSRPCVCVRECLLLCVRIAPKFFSSHPNIGGCECSIPFKHAHAPAHTNMSCTFLILFFVNSLAGYFFCTQLI